MGNFRVIEKAVSGKFQIEEENWSGDCDGIRYFWVVRKKKKTVKKKFLFWSYSKTIKVPHLFDSKDNAMKYLTGILERREAMTDKVVFKTGERE